MITLVLNAAEGRVQFVLAQHEAKNNDEIGTEADASLWRILCHHELDAPSRGTELLPPALHNALRALDLTPQDVGRIACVHGPGSFTGIRLVLAFASGFRRAVGCPVGGINYLHALAASVPEFPGISGLPTRRRVLTHARRDLVHRQDFVVGLTGTEGLVPASEPEMVALEQALNGLDGQSGPTLLLGSGYDRNREALAPYLDRERFQEQNAPKGRVFCPLPGMDQPTAKALVSLAQKADYAATDLEPLYLRPCDAVSNLPHIAGKRGDDAQEALKRLDALLERTPVPED